jgi:Flp pilus assembly pilin Flp
MKLFKLTRKFRDDEDGAVTVDWVVLTAAIVGMGVAVMTTVKSGTESVATKISQGLGAVSVEGVD